LLPQRSLAFSWSHESAPFFLRLYRRFIRSSVRGLWVRRHLFQHGFELQYTRCSYHNAQVDRDIGSCHHPLLSRNILNDNLSLSFILWSSVKNTKNACFGQKYQLFRSGLYQCFGQMYQSERSDAGGLIFTLLGPSVSMKNVSFSSIHL
jgi:hypothetical protein